MDWLKRLEDEHQIVLGKTEAINNAIIESDNGLRDDISDVQLAFLRCQKQVMDALEEILWMRIKDAKK